MPDSQLLANYADIAIQVGIALEQGDRLLVQSSLDAAEFTRMIVERAYTAGASNVDVFWSDDAISRARFEHGTDAASEAVSS
ncbi:MAG: aminopeptidase, partial [Acidimicrobiia bacterium]|nr:aminopeptidase [Acidimicrobiia bacterium]